MTAWFTIARHDITDKPMSTLGLNFADCTALIDVLASQLRTRQQTVSKWDDYWRGGQPLEFLHPIVRQEVGERLKNLLLNFPRLALNSLEERLDVEGFRVAGKNTTDPDLWSIWQANDFDLASGRCHLRSLRHGEAFVSVWANPSGGPSPRMRVETAKEMITDVEPGSGATRAALKTWTDGPTEFATLYLPDRILKVWRGGEAPKAIDGASDWVIRQDGDIANTLGIVPVVTFSNNYDEDMPHGESELTDVVHIADAINKLATDMMVTSEFHAMPRRWATGIEIPKGSEGTRLEAEARKYWDKAVAGKTWIAGKDVQFGQFAAADLQNFVHAITMLSTQLAALAGLPPHYVGISHNNPASADAIRSAEASLVKRAQRKQRTFGEAWEDVMLLAVMVRDGELSDEYNSIETIWRSAETPTVAQKADAAVKLMTAGLITVEQGQEDLGYSPEQRRIMTQARADAIAAQATSEMRARVAQATALMTEFGVDEKIAFAAVGLILPPKGVGGGPAALTPPEGDPAVAPVTDDTAPAGTQ